MPTRGNRRSSRGIPRDRDNQKRSFGPTPVSVRAGSIDADWRSRNKFELIPSISRSSGVEPDGDTLKDPDVQERYREFLQQKLDAYWKRYDSPLNSGGGSDAQKAEVESNILIQFRKLREGISSSKRHDQFAIEDNSILSPLLPDLYLSVTSPKAESSSGLTVLLASLHMLERHYPSQRAFFDLSKSLPPSFALRDDHQVWLRELSRSLRRCRYSQFWRLTQKVSLERLIPPETHDHTSLPPGPGLTVLSLQILVTSLRDHFRLSTWGTVRSAYREFALPISDTAAWLSDVLLLEPDSRKQRADGDYDRVQLWFTSRENLGEVVRKGGTDGRWTVKTKK
ncbi:hypothetical protein BC827DRAFT_1162577 [Russula dissimulans]|nr:hypothetical protein BC827DRAFT_1162577 [Russula dissimulans]